MLVIPHQYQNKKKMPSQFLKSLVMVPTAKPWLGDSAVAASAPTSHLPWLQRASVLSQVPVSTDRPTALLPARAGFLLRSQ